MHESLLGSRDGVLQRSQSRLYALCACGWLSFFVSLALDHAAGVILAQCGLCLSAAGAFYASAPGPLRGSLVAAHGVVLTGYAFTREHAIGITTGIVFGIALLIGGLYVRHLALEAAQHQVKTIAAARSAMGAMSVDERDGSFSGRLSEAGVVDEEDPGMLNRTLSVRGYKPPRATPLFGGEESGTLQGDLKATPPAFSEGFMMMPDR